MSESAAPDDRRASGAPAFRADPTHPVVHDEERRRAQAMLRGIPHFSDVPAHHVRELAQVAHTETFEAGEAIIRMGEYGSTMYVIRSGRVQVVRGGPEAPIVLATLGPGEFFGELSIFDREVRSATVLAVEDTETLTIGRYDIVRLVSRSPELALALLKSLGARLRTANDRLSNGWPSVPRS
ncbi:MAG: cyclic nucleotide-binding domain-containing protein [Chloroflexota bacterium]|nr:cyclic nucleotide-binding domain-containing protein [Chloroflexota bacterium]